MNEVNYKRTSFWCWLAQVREDSPPPPSTKTWPHPASFFTLIHDSTKSHLGNQCKKEPQLTKHMSNAWYHFILANFLQINDNLIHCCCTLCLNRIQHSRNAVLTCYENSLRNIMPSMAKCIHVHVEVISTCTCIRNVSALQSTLYKEDKT